jgi:general secretion pathway protein L
MNWRGFLDWWLTQLLEWVPERLKDRLQPAPDALVLEIDREATRVYADIKGARQEFGAVPTADSEARRGALQSFVAKLARRPEWLEVRLPAGRFLQRELTLPLAAADNLNEAVGFQLDRLTPFSPDDTLYQCGIIARDPAAKQLRAWVAVTPRQPVEQALALLGEAPSPAPRPPKEAPGAGGPMRLRYNYAGGGRHHRLTWALVVLNLALLGGAMAVHLDKRQQELETLEQALTQVRREAAEAGDLMESIEQLRAEAVALRERRTALPLLVAALEDLTERLDDATWLQRFEARDGTLKLHGVSGSASTLIGQLEASPLLADVRFEAAVNRDAASGGDRFSITARLVNPEPQVAQEAAP